MVKILHGGLMEKTLNSTDESIAPGVFRKLAGPATAAAGFAGNIAQIPQELFSGAAELVNKQYPNEPMTGKRLPWDTRETKPREENIENPFTTNQLRNRLSKETGYERKSLDPQGFGEEAIDLFSGNLPLALATGGASFATLGLDLLGSAGQLTARKAGLGPVGEIGGAIIGSNLPSLAKSAGKGVSKLFGSTTKQAPKNVLTHMKDVTRELYEESKNVLKGVKVDAKPIADALEKQFDDIATRFPNAENNQALKNWVHAAESISEGKLDINRAKNLKQTFSNEAYNKNHTPWLREQYRKASEYIKDWIYGQEETIGKGITDYKRANELNTLVKTQEQFERLIDKNATLSSLLDKSFLKSIFAGGAKLAAIKPISRAGRFFKTPEAQKYWGDATKALAINNENAAVSALNKLARKAITFDKEDKPKAKRGIKIIKGGLL